MDDTVTPTPLQLARTLEAHLEQYRLAATLQRGEARQLLAQEPPDYSAAATACHRALQFTRQAGALEQLARDAGL